MCVCVCVSSPFAHPFIGIKCSDTKQFHFNFFFSSEFDKIWSTIPDAFIIVTFLELLNKAAAVHFCFVTFNDGWAMCVCVIIFQELCLVRQWSLFLSLLSFDSVSFFSHCQARASVPFETCAAERSSHLKIRRQKNCQCSVVVTYSRATTANKFFSFSIIIKFASSTMSLSFVAAISIPLHRWTSV